MTLPMDIESWNRLEGQATFHEAADRGEGALAHVEHYVREAVLQAQPGTFFGHSCKVVNALYLNCSEIGNVLARSADVSITWFERKDGQIQFSLRSQGDVDVSAMARVYKGGGHMHAAGFSLPLRTGRILLDIVLGRIPAMWAKLYDELKPAHPSSEELTRAWIEDIQKPAVHRVGLRVPNDPVPAWIDTLDV